MRNGPEGAKRAHRWKSTVLDTDWNERFATWFQLEIGVKLGLGMPSDCSTWNVRIVNSCSTWNNPLPSFWRVFYKCS